MGEFYEILKDNPDNLGDMLARGLWLVRGTLPIWEIRISFQFGAGEPDGNRAAG